MKVFKVVVFGCGGWGLPEGGEVLGIVAVVVVVVQEVVVVLVSTGEECWPVWWCIKGTIHYDMQDAHEFTINMNFKLPDEVYHDKMSNLTPAK